jgi:hypothetical protein
MFQFQVVPIPSSVAEHVRRTRSSPRYRHPAHQEVADSYGPCRLCLRKFRRGQDERLLFTYDPFHGLSDYPSPGPVFVHAGVCDPYQGGAGVPGDLLEIPLVLEAYAEDRWLLTREPAQGGEVEPAISRLLAIPAVEYLHIRNREAGCYIARVERVPSGEGS